MRAACLNPSVTLTILIASVCVLSGCNSETAQPGEEPSKPAASQPANPPQKATGDSTADQSNASKQRQLDAEQVEALLAARLPDDELSQGWVRLFDGITLMGWQRQPLANFHVADNAIVADEGQPCLLTTESMWKDFELKVEFQAEAGTNSGVFVRTPATGTDPSKNCYEINIAADDDPFPTGSVVKRQKVDATAAGPQTPDQWRQMSIIALGDQITVKLGDQIVCEYQAPNPLPARHIGLQHRFGRIAFRNVLIRPLGLENLLDAELAQWNQYPEMPGSFTINEDQQLHVQGGRTQLETKSSYGDFTLLARYKIDEPNMNSGIFFRCIPGDEMMGYECQVNNDYETSRTEPADHGTGGIFRRQEARLVAGDNGQWATVLLQASGNKIAAWVNGIQVSQWQDKRKPHENPRKGQRTEPGTIMIQGHDPGTDVLYSNLEISSL